MEIKRAQLAWCAYHQPQRRKINSPGSSHNNNKYKCNRQRLDGLVGRDACCACVFGSLLLAFCVHQASGFIALGFSPHNGPTRNAKTQTPSRPSIHPSTGLHLNSPLFVGTCIIISEYLGRSRRTGDVLRVRIMGQDKRDLAVRAQDDARKPTRSN